MDTSAMLSFQINTSLKLINWQDPLFDCSSWKIGRAAFGYGSAEVVTYISKVQTVYFRNEFFVTNPDAITYLAAILKYDNGAVVYLNGHDIERVNMPSGDISFDAEKLRWLKSGRNVVAVEMHQNPSDSSDLIFDIRLIKPDPLIEFGAEWYFFDFGQRPEDQTIATSAENQFGEMPGHFEVYQNYPNPFNSVSAICYQLSACSQVEIAIFDLLGKKVLTLVNEKQTAGHYRTEVDASDLATGVYFYQIKAGEFIRIRKMIVLQ